MSGTFQANQFSPITAYDMPGVLFQQLLDDELTFTGIKNTILQSHKLSPEERNSFADGLKDRAGRNPVTDSLIDIATNPWVWFAFLTTPGVPTALKKSTKSIYEGSRYGAFIREHTPFLASFGLWSSSSLFQNTALVPAMRKLASIRAGYIGDSNARVAEARNLVIETLNSKGIKVNSLDPLRAPVKHRELMHDIDMSIHAKLNGWDTYQTNLIPVAQSQWSIRRTNVDGEWYQVVGSLSKNEKILLNRQQKILENAKIDIERGMSLEDALDKYAVEKTIYDEAGNVERKVFDNALLDGITKSETLSVTRIKEPLEVGITSMPSGMSHQLVNPDGKLKTLMDEFELQPLVDAYRSDLDEQMLLLYGNEELIRSGRYANASDALNAFRENKLDIDELIDPNKVSRISKSANNEAITEQLRDPLMREDVSITAGRRLLNEFYDINPTDISKMTQEQVDNQIRKVFDVHLRNRNYFPFGLREYIAADGTPIYSRGAKQAARDRSLYASGMNIPRVKNPDDHLLHPEDIDRLRSFAEGPTGPGQHILDTLDNMERTTSYRMKNLPAGYGIAVRRVAADRSLNLYTQRAAETYALNVAGATRVGGANVYDPAVWDDISDLQRVQADDLSKTESGKKRGEVSLYDTPGFGEAKIKDVFMDLVKKGEEPPGGYSLADVLNQGYKGMHESQEFSRALLKDTLLPRLMGRRTVGEMSNYSMSALVKDVSTRFAKGPIGEAIKGSGEFGRTFINEMEEMGKVHSPFSSPRMASGQMAKYLYVTHLGANMASVILNLTQPWMHTATIVGMDSVIAGYGRAFAEMGSYFDKRMKSGKFVESDEKVVELINSSFKHAKDDLLGIGPDVYSLQDELSNFANLTPSKTETALFKVPMKLFEKSEWLNRLVSAHAVDHMFEKAGRFATEGADYRFRMRTVRDIVDETQFGGSVLNTPTIFMGKGIIGQFGDSPLLRQFLTFPVRTLTAITPGIGRLSEGIGGGNRVIAGKEFALGPFATLADFSRGMGIASMLYYTGKNFLDADLSRGLIANASTDMFGGQDFLEGGEYDWFPAPPAFDILIQSARGLLGGDMELFRRTLPRMLPSGVGLARVLSIQPENVGLPNVFSNLTSQFQRNYADWDNPTPDGLVPYFKGDGTFIDFRKPADLVLQGLGLDLGKSKIKGELDGYLVKQREEILKYRNEYLNALFANNPRKAEGVKAEFERRFKIPLTITKENLRSRMRNRNITRTERILDRIPPEARSQYMKFLAARGDEMGVDPNAYTGETPTSTSRSKEFDRPNNTDLDPETIKILKQMVRESKNEPPPLREASFTESYRPFDWQ